MTLADRIQQLRKQKGISQEELADRVGVSRQAVSKWESAQSVPDLDKILLLSDYFDHVLQVAKWGQFDSLAHLTYPLRYILAQPGLRVELSKYREKIDAVLLELIQQKKALEVNTSGLRQQIGDTLPDAGIVRRFYELGGTYVTLGSDAHRWADVSAGIEEAMSMIYKTGFRHYTIYSKREPRLVPIE